MSEKSNKQRKSDQKKAYHSEFKPHLKPRSRKWTNKRQKDVQVKYRKK